MLLNQCFQDRCYDLRKAKYNFIQCCLFIYFVCRGMCKIVLLLVLQSCFQINLAIEIMQLPETPTLKRTSSSKRIIISSPSQELLHFLTIPNPSASQDPRQRLHIIAPKNKIRSVSNSQEHEAKGENSKKKPNVQSRITFIRKKGWNQCSGKKEMEFRQNKLRLSTNYKKETCKLESTDESVEVKGGCRFDFTFGFNRDPMWLQA